MKINTSLPENLKSFYQEELSKYRSAFGKGHLQLAWNHLERAHIIGQAYSIAHSYVHWKMLQFGFHIKDYREILGQIPRLLVGGVKSFVGKIPVGNTGGANVNPLKPMEIPEDIQRMFGEIST
ncbi:MAG: hypothetical protein ACJAVY_001106 [Marinoscillum sp.]|jgi:hypothetical protein